MHDPRSREANSQSLPPSSRIFHSLIILTIRLYDLNDILHILFLSFDNSFKTGSMSNTKEGINPLRPYHVPQPIIQHPIELPSNSTAPPAGASSSKSTKHGLGSSARDMLSDLDYSDYLSDASPSVLEIVKSLLDQGLWKYTSVLMAQPFDLAKVILQVQDAGSITGEEEERDKSKRGSRTKSRPYDVGAESSSSICSS